MSKCVQKHDSPQNGSSLSERWHRKVHCPNYYSRRDTFSIRKWYIGQHTVPRHTPLFTAPMFFSFFSGRGRFSCVWQTFIGQNEYWLANVLLPLLFDKWFHYLPPHYLYLYYSFNRATQDIARSVGLLADFSFTKSIAYGSTSTKVKL